MSLIIMFSTPYVIGPIGIPYSFGFALVKIFDSKLSLKLIHSGHMIILMIINVVNLKTSVLNDFNFGLILPCYQSVSMFELDFRVSYKLGVRSVFDMNHQSVLVDGNMSIENKQNETEIMLSYLI